MKPPVINLPKIERGVKIPPRYKSDWQSLYSQMKPGDSFTLASENQCKSAQNSAKFAGVKITTRKVNGSGYRIWRIK